MPAAGRCRVPPIFWAALPVPHLVWHNLCALALFPCASLSCALWPSSVGARPRGTRGTVRAPKRSARGWSASARFRAFPMLSVPAYPLSIPILLPRMCSLCIHPCPLRLINALCAPALCPRLPRGAVAHGPEQINEGQLPYDGPGLLRYSTPSHALPQRSAMIATTQRHDCHNAVS